jgi:hypothetical protein
METHLKVVSIYSTSNAKRLLYVVMYVIAVRIGSKYEYELDACTNNSKGRYVVKK